MQTTPHVVGARDGRYVQFQGFGTRYVVSGEQTGGAFALVEHDLVPRALGAPMHTHSREDEVSHVLAGRLGAQIGDEVLEAVPGDTVVKPRGIPHAFWNPGDEPVRFLELITPPAFAQYFKDIAPLLNSTPPDFEALGAVMQRYELAMEMETMGPLIERHGLNPMPEPPG
jgi:quercetin dioxygenase-like cupin family protein